VREEFSELHKTAVQQPKKVGVRCRLGLLALQLNRFNPARVRFQATLAIKPRRAKALRNLQP
jgi:Flp pilus assembly protein TadD